MNLKKRVISGLTRAAELRGYDLVPHWRRDAQPLAHHLRAVFARHNVDSVFDVGGNLGQYHDFLRNEVGFAGPIVSFEPVAKYIRILRDRAEADPKWTIVGHALGSECSTAEINVTRSPGLNSFLEPSRDAVPTFWDASPIEKETVRIERLDDVYDALRTKIGIIRPYLKLDTQGFDLEVVRGAAHVLTNVVAMQTEASIKPIYASMPSYTETITAMSSNGFQLSGMFPVTHDDDLRLIEFDCVMVR